LHDEKYKRKEALSASSDGKRLAHFRNSEILGANQGQRLPSAPGSKEEDDVDFRWGNAEVGNADC